MVNLKNLLESDPTLLAADAALVEYAAKQVKRDYLGASVIGEPCSRKLWYGLQPDIERKPFDAASLKRFADGFYVEDVTIKRLRAVSGVELWDRQEDGEQIGGKLFNGKFGYHVDGVIRGLIQSPKTPHVFECKAVNEVKFNKFKKLKLELGEKQTLAAWDVIYFAQAIIYCYLLELTRHYTVVCTPGARDWDSCRTEANNKMGEQLLRKSERVINAKDAPERISNDKNFYLCKFCDYRDACHG